MLLKTLVEANAKIRLNFVRFCVQLSRKYKEFVHLGHVAEAPGGGERENCTKFCALLPVLEIQSRIRILTYLGLLDPDSLVRGMDPDLDPSASVSAHSCHEFMVFGRLCHIAEDPSVGECENSIKFCAFLRTVVVNLWCLFVYSTLLMPLVEANAKIRQILCVSVYSCREN